MEEEFLKSWDNLEAGYQSRIKSYEDLPWVDEHLALYKKILDFVKTLRSLGYDRKFRAGGQMGYLFLLSRSLDHWLAPHQTFLSFSLDNEKQKEQLRVVFRSSRDITYTKSILAKENIEKTNAMLESRWPPFARRGSQSSVLITNFEYSIFLEDMLKRLEREPIDDPNEYRYRKE